MPTCQAKKGRKGVQVGKFTSIPPLSLSLFKAIVHQRRGIGLEGLLVEAVFSNEPPTYCTDCTLQRGRFLTFTALPLVFRRRPEGDASAQRSPRLSRIPPPPLMGAPYKESLEVSYRNLASQLADCKKLACFLRSPLICSPFALLPSLNSGSNTLANFLHPPLN